MGRVVQRALAHIANTSAWLVLGIVVLACTDIITRKLTSVGLLPTEVRAFLPHSAQLQEGQWYLHTILFFFGFGSAYLSKNHVRVDVLRTQASPRARRLIERVGIVLLLLPFCVVVTWAGVEFAVASLQQHEVSTTARGLPDRWLIKSVIPLGMVLAIIAALLVFISPPEEESAGD